MFVYVSFGRLFCNAWLNAHNTGNECKFMAIFFALLFGACGVLQQQWRSCFYIFFVMCTSITCMLLPLLLEQYLLCVLQSEKEGECSKLLFAQDCHHEGNLSSASNAVGSHALLFAWNANTLGIITASHRSDPRKASLDNWSISHAVHLKKAL